MIARTIPTWLLLVTITGGALSHVANVSAAQPPYLSSDQQDIERLVADRNKFVHDMYQAGGSESAKILDALRELMPAQAQYQRESALTLSRLRLAMTITYHDSSVSQDQRSARWKKFHRQYYSILAKAPLSLRNTIRVVEASLPSEIVSAGRARMAERLSEQVKAAGEAFDIEKIDGIVMGEIAAGPAPAIQLPERPAPQPVVVTHDDTPPPANPAQPAVTQARPATPPPPPAPATPRVPPGAPLPEAPLLEQWNAALTSATEKYEYDATQLETAKGVVNQSIKSAEALLAQSKAAMDEAAAMVDGPEKTKKMDELKMPINRLYDSMVKRLDSLASIEQKNRAAAQAAGR
ncbi:hypothetical protein B7486_11180 [cyanobacterium TDX16]|nr:hypothetical protein B7486_11180 [cyanobacterium TDX16]